MLAKHHVTYLGVKIVIILLKETYETNVLYTFLHIAQLYVKVDILLTYRTYLYDRITSLRRDDWAHKTSLTTPFNWGVCTKPGRWAVMYLSVKVIDFVFLL